jgi:hypothetical protein
MKWIKNIFETEEDKEISDLIVNGQPHWLAQVIVDQRKVRREKVEKHSKINHVRRHLCQNLGIKKQNSATHVPDVMKNLVDMQ